jgi:hypothetical protein
VFFRKQNSPFNLQTIKSPNVKSILSFFIGRKELSKGVLIFGKIHFIIRVTIRNGKVKSPIKALLPLNNSPSLSKCSL